MQDVLRDICLVYGVVHDIGEWSHLVRTSFFILVHIASLHQQFFIEEALVPRVLFEAVWDAIVAITNDGHAEIVLGKLVFLVVGAEAIVVVDDSAERVFEFKLVLVVHGDTNGHGGRALTLPASSTDIGKKTVRVLNLPCPAVLTEAGPSHSRIKLTARQHERLISRVRPWLPLDVLHSHPCVV